jgi:rhamnosyltransferase
MISIIIRTKNEEKWIGQCIESIKKQDFQDFEIIIIDNLSKDNTIKIIKRKNIKKLKIIKINNFRPGKAINLGIENSLGDYICILSAHCIPKNSKWLGKLYENLKNNKKTAAVYGKQIPLAFSSNLAKRDLLLTFGNDKRVQVKDYFFHNANSLIKKEVLSRYPFSNQVSNLEDRLWAKTIITKYNIIYEPEAIVYHHHGLHHDNNKIRSSGVTSVMEKVDLNQVDKEVPDIFNPKKSIISAVLPIKSALLTSNEKKILKRILKELLNSKFINNIYLVTDKLQIKLPKNIEFIDRKLIKNSLKKSIGELLSDVQNILEKKKKYSDYFIFISYDYLYFSQKKLDKLIRANHANGNDSTFFGYTEYNHYWQKKNDVFEQTDKSTLPLIKRQPLYKALYGLGTIVSSWLLRKKQITGGKIGIFPVDDLKYTFRFSKINKDLKKLLIK